MNTPLYLIDEPKEAKATFIFAHGAGAGMDSPFMAHIAKGLWDNQIKVIRFEFPYMRRRRLEGTRSPPNPAGKLLQSWRNVIEEHRTAKPLFIGGKSMGGRIASMVADEMSVTGAICFGYPFHPPGKPEKLRTQHLIALKTPCLIIQGERDTFGNSTEVPQYGLSNQISIAWLADGDHSFKPRKASGYRQEDHWSASVEKSASFIGKHLTQ